MDIDKLDVTEFAFPFHRDAGFEQHGITKREYFAAKAMLAYLSKSKTFMHHEELLKVLPERCCKIADSVLKELNKENGGD